MQKFGLILLLLTSGCTFAVGSNYESPRFYVLRDLNEPDAKVHTPLPLRLEVTETKAARFINSQKIIYSDNGSTWQFYRLASWVETPPRRLTSIFLERLRSAQIFTSVSSQASAAVADVQLSLELQQFYQDTAADPNVVRVGVWAELLDLKTREIVAGKQFVTSAEVDSYDVEGAVGAFEVAVDKLFDELFEWFISNAATCPAMSEANRRTAIQN